MARFLVLPREAAETFAGVSPSEMQRIIEKYLAWSGKLAEAGHLEGGEKLEDGQGRVLRKSANGMDVTDGPFAEAKEVVGGFWILKADDYEEAVRLASDCPHLAYGTLEVRRIEEFDAPS